jgi:hypothetical protein
MMNLWKFLQHLIGGNDIFYINDVGELYQKDQVQLDYRKASSHRLRVTVYVRIK